MNTKKMVKNISRVGMGILIVGATMIGAAATDLSDYPNMFIDEDGSFNGVLVVGANARAEDVIGVTNIATSLQSISVTKTTSVLDESLQVSEGYQLCNNNLYVGTSIAECEPSVDESDLDLLADDVYHDAEGDNDNDEKYIQRIIFSDDATGQFIYTQDDNDAPEADTYLFVDNTQHYLYTFELGFDSGVIVDDDSSSTAGDDLEGTSIMIQGMNYVITDVKMSGGEISELEMQSSDGSVWMSEGESITKTIDGVEHTIELMDVSADVTEDSGSCGFDIDGIQVWIDVKDTETVNGITIGITDAKRVNMETQNQDVCEVVPASREITVVDGDELKFNNEAVDGTHAEITGSTSGSDFKWTGLEISWALDNGEMYMASGDEFIDPMFGMFKLVFAGIENRGTEIISFDAGSSNVDITFRNEDGTLVELPLSASASSQAGEATDEPVYWGNEAPQSSSAQQDELIYLEGETCTGTANVADCQGAQFLVIEPTKDEAHLIQITSIDMNDNEINFDDLTYGTTDDDVPYTDGVATTLALKSAGNVMLLINETSKIITFDDIGSFDGAIIKTENRAELEIVNTDLDSQEFDGMIFNEFDDGSLDASDYVAGMEVDIIYDDSIDNSVEIASSSVSVLDSSVGYGFFATDEDNDNDQKFMTKKGTLVTYDNKDNSELTIEHPYDTAYAMMYLAPTSASVGQNVATETTVHPISVSAVKLDTEIENVDEQNIIAVGGACANAVVAELMDNPKDCANSMGLKSGQALIKLFENGEYVAVVVAGQDAMDTRFASEILSNWEDYDLSGNEMIATTVSRSSLSVKQNSVVYSEVWCCAVV